MANGNSTSGLGFYRKNKELFLYSSTIKEKICDLNYYNWFHLAFTYNSGSCIIFKDGEKIDERSISLDTSFFFIGNEALAAGLTDDTFVGNEILIGGKFYIRNFKLYDKCKYTTSFTPSQETTQVENEKVNIFDSFHISRKFKSSKNFLNDYTLYPFIQNAGCYMLSSSDNTTIFADEEMKSTIGTHYTDKTSKTYHTFQDLIVHYPRKRGLLKNKGTEFSYGYYPNDLFFGEIVNFYGFTTGINNKNGQLLSARQCLGGGIGDKFTVPSIFGIMCQGDGAPGADGHWS